MAEFEDTATHEVVADGGAEVAEQEYKALCFDGTTELTVLHFYFADA